MKSYYFALLILFCILFAGKTNMLASDRYSMLNASVSQDSVKQKEAVDAAKRKADEDQKMKKEKKAAETRDPREAAFHDAVAEIETPVSGYSNSAIQPNASMKVQLDKKVEKLKSFPDIKIKVTGHTCDQGSEDVNKKIAQKRADAVKDYFISKGIDISRIKTDSKGKEEPIEANTSDTNRKLNRRVEFKVE